MFSISINIADYCFLIQCNNKKVYDYIYQEYKTFIISNENNNYNSIINIHSKSKVLLQDYHCIRKNFYYDFTSKNLLQKLKSKSCTSWISFDQNFKNIDVYIPYKIKNNEIRKVLNPKFLPRWKNCLIDFFHGPFLGILEYFLIENNSTFIHGSSFCHNKKGYVFSGKAQVGKTEIVNLIKKNAEILSDDLTIISSDSFIYPYQKSIGTFLDNINIKEYFRNKNFISKIIEIFNIVLFKLLGFKPKRIIFFKDVFSNIFKKEKVRVDKIYFIDRLRNKYSCIQLKKSTYITDMSKILENEFSNLPGFWFILEECTNLNKEKFMKMVEECLGNCLSSVELVNINIPFYDNKEDFRKELKYILFNVIKEGNDQNENYR